jgi:hypothetical protein
LRHGSHCLFLVKAEIGSCREHLMGKDRMRYGIRSCIRSVGICLGLLLATAANAQQQAQPAAQRNQVYDVSRETVLEGMVIAYTESSTKPPLGAHVTIETASGAVDVHVGDARLLTANHFSLASGDHVRIVGETLACGKGIQFVARVIQRGNDVLALRSTRGFTLSPGGKFGPRTARGAL